MNFGDVCICRTCLVLTSHMNFGDVCICRTCLVLTSTSHEFW